jgi:predicted nucleic acid-binding Zn ribbon protein
VPVIFKGSGFYCTDHGGSSACNSADKCKETECKAKTEAKKTETKKTEAKKEAKTEDKS